MKINQIINDLNDRVLVHSSWGDLKKPLLKGQVAEVSGWRGAVYIDGLRAEPGIFYRNREGLGIFKVSELIREPSTEIVDRAIDKAVDDQIRSGMPRKKLV